MSNDNTILTEGDAAKFLGISVSSLRKWRMDETKYTKDFQPPPFIKINRSVRYLKEDLLKYIKSNRVEFVLSTKVKRRAK